MITDDQTTPRDLTQVVSLAPFSRGSSRLLPPLAGALLLLTLQGCSVYLASTQPDKKDLGVLDPGIPRTVVIAELGPPHSTEEQMGVKTDLFRFRDGYSKFIKAVRVISHITLDVFSFGVWEAIWFPLESKLSGTDLTMQVTYDHNERVQKVEDLSGSIRTSMLDELKSVAYELERPGRPPRDRYDPSGSIPTSRVHADEQLDGFPNAPPSVSVVPILMPQPLTQLPERVALIPVSQIASPSVSASLDLALAFLQTRHPGLHVVEREGLEWVTKEILLQHSGRTEDSTIVHVGKWTGADTLLTHRIEATPPERFETVSESGGTVSVAVGIRLIQVESGVSLLRQTATATIQVPPPPQHRIWPKGVFEKAYREALRYAQAYALSALTAAFGDSPLGIVPDLSIAGDGIRVLGVLHGGPAHVAGLIPGDRILTVNSAPVVSIAQSISLPATLVVARGGAQKEIVVPIKANKGPA